MDLKSGYPFWAVKNGLMYEAPPLIRDLDTDVLIIGAGITGALICDELQQDGHHVTVVDQRDVAWGSTAASTALLQYEIDTPLTELADLYGEEKAVLAYHACESAVKKMADIAERAGRDVGYASQQSLYYASSQSHTEQLRAEYEMRRSAGFDVVLLEQDDLYSRFGVRAPLAILSAVAARVDPYRLASKLLRHSVEKGASVFDRSVVIALKPTSNGVTVDFQSGAVVRANHVVMAAGYASQEWLDDDVAVNRSSYAFITDPMPESRLGGLGNTLVWETARPYFYLRTTEDGRVLVGGEDDSIDVPLKRDASVDKKARRLVEKVKASIPHLDLEPAFAWAGTFAETDDGLPYVGIHDQWGPNVHFAMAYGGNGITYSTIGAEILRAELAGGEHPLAELFSFRRKELAVRRGVAEKIRQFFRTSTGRALQPE